MSPSSLQEHHKPPYRHMPSPAAAFYSSTGNRLMLLRRGAPQLPGTSASRACPSETRSMGHPHAAHLPVPKGTLCPNPPAAGGEGGTPEGWVLLGAAHPPGRTQGLIFALRRGRLRFGTREEDVHVSRLNLLLEGKTLSGKHV